MSNEMKQQVEKGAQGGGTGMGVGGVGSSKGGQESTIVPPISVLVVDGECPIVLDLVTGTGLMRM